MTDTDDCDDKKILFVTALIAILLGSVLVNLWIRVINNFTYHTLKLNPDSTVWAIVIALIATGILVIYVIFVLDSDTSKQIRRTLTGVTFGASANSANGAAAGINPGSDLIDVSSYHDVDAVNVQLES
jgi:hypothetical protein